MGEPGVPLQQLEDLAHPPTLRRGAGTDGRRHHLRVSASRSTVTGCPATVSSTWPVCSPEARSRRRPGCRTARCVGCRGRRSSTAGCRRRRTRRTSTTRSTRRVPSDRISTTSRTSVAAIRAGLPSTRCCGSRRRPESGPSAVSRRHDLDRGPAVSSVGSCSSSRYPSRIAGRLVPGQRHRRHHDQPLHQLQPHPLGSPAAHPTPPASAGGWATSGSSPSPSDRAASSHAPPTVRGRSADVGG